MNSIINQYHQSVSSSHCQPSDNKFRQYHQIYVKKALKSVKRTKNPRIHRPTGRLKKQLASSFLNIPSYLPLKNPRRNFLSEQTQFFAKKVLKSVKRAKNPPFHRLTDRLKDSKDSWRTRTSILISFCPSKSPDEIFRLARQNFSSEV